MPTRTEFQTLAKARLEDVRALHGAGRYDGAAYMCGYVVELSLKACICRRLRLSGYPPGGDELKRAFKSHKFETLLVLSGLKEEMTIGKDPRLFAKWAIITSWSPDWRYRSVGSATKKTVDGMMGALLGPEGVLAWLKRRW